MMWRTFFFALLMAGTLAQHQETDEMRTMIRQVLAQACDKSHTGEQLDVVMNSVKTFVSCLKNLMDIEVIAKEVNEAKKNGALDEVFRKYCIKSPQLKMCLKDVVDGIAPCIHSSNRDQLFTGKKATDQLLDFVCYKDGDRIAMFLAEGGAECFTKKLSDIEKCFHTHKPAVDQLKRENKTLSLEEQCDKYDELSACIVKALETCATPTPGNMVESLLKYVRNELPCKKQR